MPRAPFANLHYFQLHSVLNIINKYVNSPLSPSKIPLFLQTVLWIASKVELFCHSVPVPRLTLKFINFIDDRFLTLFTAPNIAVSTSIRTPHMHCHLVSYRDLQEAKHQTQHMHTTMHVIRGTPMTTTTKAIPIPTWIHSCLVKTATGNYEAITSTVAGLSSSAVSSIVTS